MVRMVDIGDRSFFPWGGRGPGELFRGLDSMSLLSAMTYMRPGF